MSVITNPNVRKFSKLELLARQVVEGFITGIHKSPYHGFSVEFAEHKQYNSGQSTRHIDWKLLGKTDKFYLKTFEEETNLRCQLILDVSSSMLYPEHKKKDNKLQFSVKSIASLIYLLKRQRDAIGLSCFNDSLEFHIQPKLNEQHIQFLYKKLDEYFNKSGNFKNTSIINVLHKIADIIHKRSLIIIFSDMMDNQNNDLELFRALQHLKYNKHEIVLFHIIDKETELNFHFKNALYTFVDKETGEKIKINSVAIREEYKKQTKIRFHDFKNKCIQYKIDFVPVDIQEGFDNILYKYLSKRVKLK